jgi:hypothetical protein
MLIHPIHVFDARRLLIEAFCQLCGQKFEMHHELWTIMCPTGYNYESMIAHEWCVKETYELNDKEW